MGRSYIGVGGKPGWVPSCGCEGEGEACTLLWTKISLRLWSHLFDSQSGSQKKVSGTGVRAEDRQMANEDILDCDVMEVICQGKDRPAFLLVRLCGESISAAIE